MLFSSMIFIWVFLPITLTIYYLINFISKEKVATTHAKNIFLLIASLIFYAWGGIYFLAIMPKFNLMIGTVICIIMFTLEKMGKLLIV